MKATLMKAYNKIIGEGSAEIDLELAEDGHQVIRLNVLGGIKADAGKSNALHEIFIK
jgi:hypothetical protein